MRTTLIAVNAALAAIAVVAVTLLVLSDGRDDGPSSQAVAPSATPSGVATIGPSITPFPTVTASASGLLTPTVEPVDTSRATHAGQTTLLEVDTGRVLRWENDENVQNPRFSPDSRWLVYNQGWIPGENDLANSRIYRIDLASTDLTPQMIAVGFNPSVSSRGDIAFNRQFDGQRAHVFVAHADGSIRRLQGIGATYTAPSWSPDGRWLVFASGYIGEGIDAPVTVVDTYTWTERTVDHIANCSCDVGYFAIWSPDSRFFASFRVPRVIDTETGAITHVASTSAWAKDNAAQVDSGIDSRLHTVVTDRAPRLHTWPVTSVYLRDPTANTEVLLLTGFEGNCLRASPDRRWLIADDFCDTI